MRIIYSQKWTKEKVDQKIKRLLPFVPGIKSADLLIKVFCYTKIRKYTDEKGKVWYFGRNKYRGHYRYLRYHSFWKSEWEYFRTLKKVPIHHIVLKFHPDINDKILLHFIAHEFGHLKDWRKWEGSKNKCAQKRCDKYADKCVKKYKETNEKNLG
jgi:hypothetical protein